MATYFITQRDPLRFLTTYRLWREGTGGVIYREVLVADSELATAISPELHIKDMLSQLAHGWTRTTSEACRVAKHYDGSWIITSLPLAAELDEYWKEVAAYNGSAKVQRVVDGIRTQIQSGALKPGDQLLSTKELQEFFGVSYGTLRTALVLLMAEGLIVGQQGEARYVAERRPDA